MLFCGLLSLPLFLIVVLQLWQFHLQKEAEEKLEEGFLQTIVVSKDELTWERKNKEANINGRLFDVKFFSVENGKLVLTGLFDEEETAVKKLLQHQVFSFHGFFFQLLIMAQGFIASLYFLIDFSILLSKLKRYLTPSNNYNFLLPEIFTPPPKRFC